MRQNRPFPSLGNASIRVLAFSIFSVLVLSIAVLVLAIRVNIALAARYLRGAKGDIVARRSATIAYKRPGF